MHIVPPYLVEAPYHGKSTPFHVPDCDQGHIKVISKSSNMPVMS